MYVHLCPRRTAVTNPIQYNDGERSDNNLITARLAPYHLPFAPFLAESGLFRAADPGRPPPPPFCSMPGTSSAAYTFSPMSDPTNSSSPSSANAALMAACRRQHTAGEQHAPSALVRQAAHVCSTAAPHLHTWVHPRPLVVLGCPLRHVQLEVQDVFAFEAGVHVTHGRGQAGKV